MKEEIEDFLESLQKAQTQARQQFSIYLEKEDCLTSDQKIALLQSSFDSYQKYLQQLEQLPLPLRISIDQRLKKFIHKSQKWLNQNTITPMILSASWLQRLQQLSSYEVMLKDLVRWFQYLRYEYQDHLPSETGSIVEIPFIAWPQYTLYQIRRFVKNVEKVNFKRLAKVVSVCLLLGGIITTGYLYVPYSVQSAITIYPNDLSLSNDKWEKQEEFRYPFLLEANGSLQTLTIPLHKNLFLYQLGMSFNLRWGTLLEIEAIRILGEKNQLLKEISFRTSAKEQWQRKHVTFRGYYQIDAPGLQELKDLKWNQFYLDQLISLRGQRLTKPEFHKALKTLSLSLTPREIKTLRTIFRKPLYWQKGILNQQLFLSPIFEINQVQSLQIVALAQPLF